MIKLFLLIHLSKIFGKNNLNVIRINLLKRNELHGKGGESKIIEEDEK